MWCQRGQVESLIGRRRIVHGRIAWRSVLKILGATSLDRRRRIKRRTTTIGRRNPCITMPGLSREDGWIPDRTLTLLAPKLGDRSTKMHLRVRVRLRMRTRHEVEENLIRIMAASMNGRDTS